MQQGHTDEYAKLLRNFHQSEMDFGSGFYAFLVAQVIRQLEIQSVTDFGAGKCLLKNALISQFGICVDYQPYDPAFPEYGEPVPADLVCCVEVLEHIEPDKLTAVLSTLQQITRHFGLFTVNTAAAKKLLPDGRNSHLIQEPISWWMSQISKYFEVQWLSKTSRTGFAVLVTNLGEVERLAAPLELTQTHSLKAHLSSAWVRILAEIRSRKYANQNIQNC